MVKDTLQKVKTENKALKEQLVELQKQLEELKQNISSNQTNSAQATNVESSERSPSPLSPDKNLSVEFVSAQYDDISSFSSTVSKDIQSLTRKIDILFQRFDRLEKCFEDLEAYSYRFNIKIVGLPSDNQQGNESALQTAELCIQLFRALNAEVTINDIDTAHRVPPRNKMATHPAPIICKFVRRLAKDEVMEKWKNRSTLSAEDLGLQHDNDISRLGLYDHLTPKNQELFFEARKLKKELNYQYCWVKNGTIMLRESPASPIYKIRSLGDINKMKNQCTAFNS